jgi:ATP-dependent helicase/nuclease subunit A
LLTEVPLDVASRAVVSIDPYIESRLPVWAQRNALAPDAPLVDGARLDAEVTAWWGAVSSEAARPRFSPASITGEANEELGRWRTGRFGDRFGTTVHLAIATVIRGPAIAPAEAVARAVRRTRLNEYRDYAIADVGRAIDAVRAAGLGGEVGVTCEVEYPIAAAQSGGTLLSGYIDFVRFTEAEIHILDFKTDVPPVGQVELVYPAYVAQVRLYARLLRAAGIVAGRALRCGLLFTGDGDIRWVEAGSGSAIEGAEVHAH